MKFKRSKIRPFSFDMEDPFQDQLLDAIGEMPRGQAWAAIVQVLRIAWGADSKAPELVRKMKETLYRGPRVEKTPMAPMERQQEEKEEAPKVKMNFARLKI